MTSLRVGQVISFHYPRSTNSPYRMGEVKSVINNRLGLVEEGGFRSFLINLITPDSIKVFSQPPMTFEVGDYVINGSGTVGIICEIDGVGEDRLELLVEYPLGRIWINKDEVSLATHEQLTKEIDRKVKESAKLICECKGMANYIRDKGLTVGPNNEV